MKVVDRFINKTEQIVFDELSAVAKDNALKVFPKPRVSDVLLTGNTRLDERSFNYFTRAHFDFLVTDGDFKPLISIEYDGPSHSSPIQMERDRIKNSLCEIAHHPILRINANHVTRKFRGMTLLRWMIEVMQMQASF